ncbi:MAG TPA: class I SAM-dependent methyltransferase [Ktedonosporobacter sp.]|nr:class I SAM-dependent methyltransferase [Ktedonosporobacter sp.]
MKEEKEPGVPMFSWQSLEEAERWAQQARFRQNLFGEATRLMLEAAALRPGDHILDIAAGTGDQSLLAAQHVGPAGTVLATDISAEMLKEAAHLAEQKGFTTITTRVMNAEHLDLADQAFDAVICRLGLMLLSHQQEALREILRVLKPGRKLAALVWSTPDRHPLLSIPLAIITKYVAMPALSPNPFSLAGSGVFEQALSSAGFHEVSIQAVPIQFHFASMDAFFQQMPNNPVTTNAMKQLNQRDQQRLQEEIRQALSRFEGPEGLVFPAELLLGAGKR